MTGRPERPADAAWLALRVPADNAARESTVGPLLDPLRRFLRAFAGTAHVVDLGAGTGANLRWLAPRLPVAQRWTLVDHDAELLGQVEAPVPFSTRTARLNEIGDLLGPATPGSGTATVLTCSALLDVLTAGDVEAITATVADHGAAALFSLSVTGGVRFPSGDDVDALLATAFNDHQRRGGRLGPDAPGVARSALERHGFTVLQARTDWMLGADGPDLLVRWLRERVEAAVEQAPDLGAEARAWLARRLAQAANGDLSAVVEHVDLLALPPGAPG